jgi:hypothetical protein
MNEKRIKLIFDVLKNEKAIVPSSEVSIWLNKSLSDLRIKNNYKWKKRVFYSILLVAIISFITLLFQLERFNDHQSQKLNSVKNQTETTTTISKNQKNINNSTTADKVEKHSEFTHFKSESTILNKEELTNIPAFTEPILQVKSSLTVPLYNSYELNILPPSISKNEERNILFILDSLKAYGSAARYKMDEQDCYFQIYKDYAVISFISMNKISYASGQIHREETQVIDGHIYKVFAFQIDNTVAVSGFGNRVFFGYREKENSSSNIEIIIFSQPWAPSKIINAHKASPIEHKNLIERSNSQK